METVNILMAHKNVHHSRFLKAAQINMSLLILANKDEHERHIIS